MSRERRVSLQVPVMEGQQFLILDDGWDWTAHTNELWGEDALLRRVGIGGHRAIVVMVADDLAESVSVTVVMADEAPEGSPTEDADHVVEVSLRSESGILRVGAGDADDDARLPLPAPGSYRVRVSMTDLPSVDEVGGIGYGIEIWPATESEAQVVKWWDPWKPRSLSPVVEGRRTICGMDDFLRAIQERALTQVSSRKVDPPERLREFLPAGYKESRFLYRAGDGTLWEYRTEPPHHIPLLTELTPDEARRLFGEP